MVDQSAAPRGVLRRLLSWVLVLALVITVALPAVRLVRQLRQPTPAAYVFDEDAYYSFAVARNVATGHGPTIDGTHLTSGFQPLWTFGLAAPFLFHSHETLTLGLVGLISFVLWLLGAAMFSDLLASAVSPTPFSRREARLLFALVFLADRLLRTGYFNGLETGLYVTLVLFAAQRFVFTRRIPGPRTALHFGIVLGLVALCRLDGVVIALALALAHGLVRRVRLSGRDVVLPILIGVVMLAPWAAYNVVVAGTPVPQSGVATRAGGILDPTLSTRVRSGAEAAGSHAFWPLVPSGPLLRTSALLVALMVVPAVGWLVLRKAPLAMPPGGRAGAATIAGAVVGVCLGYVGTSGATFAYQRYFVLLKVAVLAVVGLGALVLLRTLSRSGPLLAGSAIAGLATLLVLAEPVTIDPLYMGSELLSLSARGGLASCGRVGMFESGRTGYVFPDRILNLDGKVNSDALRAQQRHALLPYLREEDVDVLYLRKPTLSSDFYALFSADFRLVPDDGTGDAVFGVRRGTNCPGLPSG